MAESIIYTPGGEFSSKSVLVEYFARTLFITVEDMGKELTWDELT